MNDVLKTVMQTKYRITEAEAIDRIEQARGENSRASGYSSSRKING